MKNVTEEMQNVYKVQNANSPKMFIRMKQLLLHSFDVILMQENNNWVTHKCHKYTFTDATSSYSTAADEWESKSTL